MIINIFSCLRGSRFRSIILVFFINIFLLLGSIEANEQSNIKRSSGLRVFDIKNHSVNKSQRIVSNHGFFKFKYALTYLNFDVGNITFSMEQDRENYILKMLGSTLPSIDFLFKASFKGSLIGNYKTKERNSAATFDFIAESKGQEIFASFKIENGSIVSNKIDRYYNDENKIELAPDSLKKLRDPFSAMLFYEEDRSEICNRTLNIFDGKDRYDLKLSFKEKKDSKLDIYNKESIICSAEFKPINDFKSRSDYVKSLQKSKDIEIGVVEVVKGLFVVSYLQTPTPIGLFKLKAENITAQGFFKSNFTG